MRGNVIRPVVIGLLTLTASMFAGSMAKAAASGAPATIAVAASPVVGPDVDRRGSVYQVVTNNDTIASGSVSIEFGVEALVDSDHPAQLRGYALIGKNNLVRSVQIDKITLGNASRGLTSTTLPANSATRNFAATNTDWAFDPKSSARCGNNYRASVSFSVRWTDGSLSKFSRLSPLAAVYC